MRSTCLLQVVSANAFPLRQMDTGSFQKWPNASSSPSTRGCRSANGTNAFDFLEDCARSEGRVVASREAGPDAANWAIVGRAAVTEAAASSVTNCGGDTGDGDANETNDASASPENEESLSDFGNGDGDLAAAVAAIVTVSSRIVRGSGKMNRNLPFHFYMLPKEAFLKWDAR